MHPAVCERLFRWPLLGGEAAEGKRRVAPALLEYAGDPVEQEEDVVFLAECKFHLARAEGFDGDDVALGELQDEHRAVYVDLEKPAFALLADGQRELFPDLEVRI